MFTEPRQAQEHRQTLSPKQRKDILSRLILTGNHGLLECFMRLNIIKPRDITDQVIRYAQKRAIISLGNIEVLNTLLAKQEELKARQQRRALHEQQIQARVEEPKKNRKRKVKEQDDGDVHPRKKPHIKEPDTCRICLDEYTTEKPATRMMPEDKECKHTAHKECFEEWCTSANTKSCIYCNQGPKRDTPEEWMQWIFGDPIIVD